jgi:hypothetical protein
LLAQQRGRNHARRDGSRGKELRLEAGICLTIHTPTRGC